MRNSRREGDTISTYAITDIKSFVCWLRSGYRSSMTGKVFSSGGSWWLVRVFLHKGNAN